MHFALSIYIFCLNFTGLLTDNSLHLALCKPVQSLAHQRLVTKAVNRRDRLKRFNQIHFKPDGDGLEADSRIHLIFRNVYNPNA